MLRIDDNNDAPTSLPPTASLSSCQHSYERTKIWTCQLPCSSHVESPIKQQWFNNPLHPWITAVATQCLLQRFFQKNMIRKRVPIGCLSNGTSFRLNLDTCGNEARRVMYVSKPHIIEAPLLQTFQEFLLCILEASHRR